MLRSGFVGVGPIDAPLCYGYPSASVVCDAQQRRQWLACQLLYIVLPWFTRSSSNTGTFYRSCCMIFDIVSCRQTCPNCANLLRIPVGKKNSWRPAITFTCCLMYSFVLFSRYDMIWQAASCSTCFQRSFRNFASPYLHVSFQLSHP